MQRTTYNCQCRARCPALSQPGNPIMKQSHLQQEQQHLYSILWYMWKMQRPGQFKHLDDAKTETNFPLCSTI